MNNDTLQLAARITLSYVGTFLFAIIVQTVSKIRAMAQHKANKAQTGSKEFFNRYTDVRILAADRSVGNFVEWMGAFLTLFWLNAFLTGDRVELGWIYVASRLLYPVLAVNGGISLAGAKPIIFLATVPGYYVLITYAWTIYAHLYR